MMKITKLTILMFCGAILISCKDSADKQKEAGQTISNKAGISLNDSLTVYTTDHLIIKRLSNQVYAHESFLNTRDFGKVSCNGMIVMHQNEAIVFDTPASDKSSDELINYVSQKLNCTIKAIIPTHFHEDCVAGLEKFNEFNIPAYASNKTISLLQMKGRKFPKPIKGFNDSLYWDVGDKKVFARYFGEGHTQDNIIGYFPDDNAIFGGCLIKELNAPKGNLADANTKEWSETVRKIKQQYPQAKIVIPGHGQWGGTQLFDYTIKLFEDKATADK